MKKSGKLKCDKVSESRSAGYRQNMRTPKQKAAPGPNWNHEGRSAPGKRNVLGFGKKG